MCAYRCLCRDIQARDLSAAYAGSRYVLLRHGMLQNAARQPITPDRMEAFNNGLDELQELVGQLLTQAQALGDDVTLQHAQQIQTVLLEELAQQRQWLNLNQALGLTPFEGQRKTLSEKGKALE